METIRFQCTSGHQLKAPASLRGKTCCCPKCGVSVNVVTVQSESLTDSAIMRILATQESLPSPQQRIVERAPQTCPRCSQVIEFHSVVCKYCRCYVGVEPEFLKQMRLGDTASTGTRKLPEDT